MSQISPSYVTGLEKYINELRNQVSSLKSELREICAAIDDPACDLTLTTVECIKKLKADYVEDMRDVLREAAQVCKDLDDEAMNKENRLACGAECADAIADLAARMNVPFFEKQR